MPKVSRTARPPTEEQEALALMVEERFDTALAKLFMRAEYRKGTFRFHHKCNSKCKPNMHWCSFGVAGYHDCDHCTAQTNNLSVHEIRIHTNIKYPCDFCAWEFVWTDPKQHHNHKVHMHGYVPNARKERDPATYIRGGNRPRKATSKISFHSYARESSVSSCATSSGSLDSSVAAPSIAPLPDSLLPSPSFPDRSCAPLFDTTTFPSSPAHSAVVSSGSDWLATSDPHPAMYGRRPSWDHSGITGVGAFSRYPSFHASTSYNSGIAPDLRTASMSTACTPQAHQFVGRGMPALLASSSCAIGSDVSASQHHPHIWMG
ncbi:hypothetical protein NM688_g4702 [Phlebia brevispora]|uniref:Uncharacterized protein n=1 Tax=Phlebia brevispora TaxID=194682 RepID=A0ACC1T2T2_9APHY|nr:hypothetical protein NM688_g4702 [Phlebia brevispora]